MKTWLPEVAVLLGFFALVVLMAWLLSLLGVSFWPVLVALTFCAVLGLAGGFFGAR